MSKYLISIAAVLSPFFFPYPVTLVLSFVASLFFPPIAFVVGVLSDLLYFVPGAFSGSLPLATITGAVLSLLALLVRRFVKARIITG